MAPAKATPCAPRFGARSSKLRYAACEMDVLLLRDGVRARPEHWQFHEVNVNGCTEVVSAARISAEMLQVKPTSLNAISFDATCRLIQRVLDRGADVVEASVAASRGRDDFREMWGGKTMRHRYRHAW